MVSQPTTCTMTYMQAHMHAHTHTIYITHSVSDAAVFPLCMLVVCSGEQWPRYWWCAEGRVLEKLQSLSSWKRYDNGNLLCIHSRFMAWKPRAQHTSQTGILDVLRDSLFPLYCSDTSYRPLWTSEHTSLLGVVWTYMYSHWVYLYLVSLRGPLYMRRYNYDCILCCRSRWLGLRHLVLGIWNSW